ncbi:hypothetical protein E4U34_002537 [Claviceps purpurea]|nr:hypothetical protein E4U28_005375 [Claviceps purpurea]KAG6160916.1 hypothetical protein E4U37_003706 [Claviceps purpurea]KAG6179234.1 hypothetical protein E4U27_003331 [Claviceps purpurea]KAG6189059.1 hypothetical protein E4U36_005831 [Claviceps purpurea]KAG6220933.1 hypothetical protein E4U34_002537 [Claviceps purpurea]
MYAQPATEVSVLVDVHTGTSHRLDPTKEDDFNGSPSPAVPSSTKGTLRRRQRSIPTNTTGGTNRGM